MPSDARKLTTACAAMLGAVSAASAAEAELDPAKPVSEIRAGVGYATDDARQFGQYNGITDKGFYPLFDFSIVRRDEATGTWVILDGRDVGMDNRQLRFEHNRQGNWRYFLEYSRIPRYEPYSAVTAVTGIGSPSLTVPAVPTTGAPLDLKTRREILGLGFDKILFGPWDVSVRFRNDQKEGARIFGRGTTGGGPPGTFGNFEFTPEPINSTIRQLEVLFGYTGEKLQVSGGYYGTMYNNRFNQLDISGGVAALAAPPATAFTPIGLPPDNHSHQLQLSGSYAFTPTTRATFRTAYTQAKQDDMFPTGVAVPLAPGIGNNLDGKVNTTFAQAGVISRPVQKLTLRADLRYEDRDDKTPIRQYFTAAGTTATGENEPRSIRTSRALAEAGYMLPYDVRLTGGVEYEEKKRNTSPVRIVSHRETTEELSYRVEARRSMSETLTGAIAYIYSDRDGSPFITTTQTGGATGSNLIAPIHLADRKRDKVRVSSTWTPLEPLTLQAYIDWADDRYSGRDGSGLGPRKGEYRNLALDAAYTFSDKWQANVWYNYNDTRTELTTCEAATAVGVCPATAADPIYDAGVRYVSNSVGFGVRGKPTAIIDVGADVSYSSIKDNYFQGAVAPAGNPAPASLPEVTTRLTRFNLFSRYAVDKQSGVRLDYIFDRFSTNDYTYRLWIYTDGTQLTQNQNQNVHFIGVSYYYRFQ